MRAQLTRVHCESTRLGGITIMASNMKRIHSVAVKRMVDDSPDTSWLGEYASRMERLNAGDWCFIGIRAEAKYSVGNSRAGYLQQTITSGGLWGIESDSDASYLADVESEELAILRAQLEEIGFSKRAITAAFKNVERENS